jgi:small subunit ribosomal protein S4
MEDLKCKKCRRAGQKLFLKKERCYSAKCSMVRKPYPPGIFGKAGGKHPKRGLSEFGLQLREKQKVRINYGLGERQFANYVKETNKKGRKDKSAGLFELLESRLDNVAYRSGFFGSRTEARQGVSHGHIAVNGRKVDIPSLRTRIGDKISIRPQSAEKSIFKDIEARLKKHGPPAWIKLEKEKKEAEIVGKPFLDDEPGMEKNLNSIIEFYSR